MRSRTRFATPLLSAVAAGVLLATLGGLTPADAGTGRAATSVQGTDVGHWSVRPAGPVGQFQVTWTSPTAIPMTDARPVITLDGTRATTTQTGPRTVTAVVGAATAPSASRLAVLLSGRTLDRRVSTAPAAPARPVTRPATTPLVADPGKPGDHKVVTSEYTLPAISVPDLPQKLEMVGHVVRPKDTDPNDPLVLFLHGRHSTCYTPKRQIPLSNIVRSERLADPSKKSVWQCPTGQAPIPSYQGYDYIQRLLASQGYVTVSISADAINDLDYAADDGGARARAQLIRRHLDHWVKWVADGTYSADMDNVFLVGHSRGGEGTGRASIVIPEKAPYRITGDVLIAPTDFGRQAPAYIPTVALLGYCDGDVSDLQGQIFTDYARTDLAADDDALHSSVLMMGANHNFFNTEWTPGQSQAPSWDDWGGSSTAPCGTQDPARLTATEQQRAAKTYIAGAVQLLTSDKTSLLPMFDGSAVHVKSAGRADVRSETVGAGRDLRRPGLDLSLGGSKGADTQICLGTSGGDQSYCGYGASYGQVPHWINYGSGFDYQQAFEMRWTKSGGYGGVDFDTPLDLSSATSLDLRTAVDPAVGDVQVDVRLHDAAGKTVTVTPEQDGIVPALEAGGSPLSKRWAQTLRVPLDGVTGLDLSAIAGVDLVAVTKAGHVWVLDYAGVHAGLPAAPDQRLAVIDMLNSTVKRHGSDSFTAKVPYKIVGDLKVDATVSVFPSSGAALKVVVPAGTHKGTFDFTVPAGSGGLNLEFDAYATQDVMTGDYTGHLVVTT